MCNICELNPCSNPCPNSRDSEQKFYCPTCGNELGDESYMLIAKKQILGCQCCIAMVSYDKLCDLF